MVNMFPAWRTELLVLGVYFEEGLDSYVLGGCEMNSWRLKMKTQCVFHLQAGIQSSHMLNVPTIQEVILTWKHVLLTHLSPTLPWEEPSAVSHRESVLYCFPTDGSTTSSCLGHSAIIKTSTHSHFSCYCTCESIHWYIHVHAHTHTHTPSQKHTGLKWPDWQSYSWFSSDSWLLMLHPWVSFFIAGGYFV